MRAQPGAVAPAPRHDGAVRVTILHINDVYEIAPVEGGRSGGLARVATLLAAAEDARTPPPDAAGRRFRLPLRASAPPGSTANGSPAAR